MPVLPEIGWETFGLGGAVIGTLFAILVWVLFFSNKRVDNAYKVSMDQYKVSDQRHQKEREEWHDKAAAARKEDAQLLTNALKEITQELRANK